MKAALTPLEARVIGCLLEKQVTTPDQYPLSLNALANACNQKSNRDPLMSLSEAEVQNLVDALVRKSLLLEKSGFGSRVSKYQQRFCNLEFSTLRFAPLELAIVTELLLRGPQTAGELRTRAARMAPVQEGTEIDVALEGLAARTPQPCVVRLSREPGRRDVRWAQLFTGEYVGEGIADTETRMVAATPAVAAIPATGAPQQARAGVAPDPGTATGTDRLARIEDEVRQLRAELEELRRTLVQRAG